MLEDLAFEYLSYGSLDETMLRQGLDSLFLSDDWIFNWFDTSWSSFARQRLQQLDSGLTWMFEGSDLQTLMHFDSRALEAWSWMLVTWMFEDLKTWWFEDLKTRISVCCTVWLKGWKACSWTLNAWIFECMKIRIFEDSNIWCFECRENYLCLALLSLLQ